MQPCISMQQVRSHRNLAEQSVTHMQHPDLLQPANTLLIADSNADCQHLPVTMTPIDPVRHELTSARNVPRPLRDDMTPAASRMRLTCLIVSREALNCAARSVSPGSAPCLSLKPALSLHINSFTIELHLLPDILRLPFNRLFIIERTISATVPTGGRCRAGCGARRRSRPSA